MEEGLIPQSIILVILLGLSAYFSGTEAAFFSLSSLEQDLLKRRTSPFLRRILETILSSPDEILITILTGNMLVNVTAATLAELLGARLFTVDSELFSIIVMTTLLLLIGEMTPKNLAVRHSQAFARATAVPLFYIYHIFKPLRSFLNLFNRAINGIFPIEAADLKAARRRIILSAVQIGFKQRILDRSELSLFESYFCFREKTAAEVMVPRTELKGVEVSTRISQLIQDTGTLINHGSSSLLPIFHQDMDHLVGYIDLKDLLPFKYGLKTGERLRSIMKAFLSVPDSKNCADLMIEMRETNTEMALVVDEYGGTAGIIAFQGLMEVLFGYFYPEKKDRVIEIGRDCYNIPGNLEINSLRDLFGQDLPTESRTVAGLITNKLEEIPAVGTRLIIGKLEFTVRKIAKNRILSVEVRRLA